MLSLALIFSLGDAGPNCDDALGASLCPDAFSLPETGACLVEKKVRKTSNGATLQRILEMMQTVSASNPRILRIEFLFILLLAG